MSTREIEERALDVVEDLIDGGDFDEEQALDVVADMLEPALNTLWDSVRAWLAEAWRRHKANAPSRKARRKARRARRKARRDKRKAEREEKRNG